MIVPHYSYDTNASGGTFNFERSKIERKQGNLDLLENTISQVMKTKYEWEIVKALQDASPVLYLDCSQKWENKILFAIMEKLIEKYPWEQTEAIFKKVVMQISMVDDEIKKVFPQDFKAFTQAYTESFANHVKSFEDREDKDEVIPKVVAFENDVALRTISKILKENKQHAYIYLDHAAALTIEEQQNINRILYTRWAVGMNDGVLFLKINDGKWARQTWSTGTWQVAQATHDYSEYSIREEDL